MYLVFHGNGIHGKSEKEKQEQRNYQDFSLLGENFTLIKKKNFILLPYNQPLHLHKCVRIFYHGNRSQYKCHGSQFLLVESPLPHVVFWPIELVLLERMALVVHIQVLDVRIPVWVLHRLALDARMLVLGVHMRVQDVHMLEQVDGMVLVGGILALDGMEHKDLS